MRPGFSPSARFDVFAQLRENSQMLVNPHGDMMIREDSKVLIMGPDAKLTDLKGKA